ncbi:AAA family ATPase [Streptomyces sp. NPDC052109]
MTRRSITVVLMCGLPGAGKTTYAMELVRAVAFGQLKAEVRREQWQQLV